MAIELDRFSRGNACCVLALLAALVSTPVVVAEAALNGPSPSETDEAQPAAPTGFSATPGDGQVTLEWDDPSDSTITGYSYSYATDLSAFTSASPPAWHAITGNSVEVAGTREVTVGTAGDLDTVGTLEDSGGGELAFDDDGGSGLNFSIRRSLSAGTYYVRVGSYGSGIGAYTLWLRADDHGDARSSATRVALPSETAGRVEHGRDVDYFRFEVSGTRVVTVGTVGHFDTVGTLEDSGGGELASDDDGGSGGNFSIRRSLSAGTYYVRVGSNSSGAYTLWLRADDHGDARSSATRVALPSETAGRIEPGSDVDYFRFEVSGTRVVTTTSHTVTGLANGTRYYFRLRATNAGGDGPAAETTTQLAASPAAAVTISDASLRKAVEGALGKSAGATITQLEMARLFRIQPPSSKVADLSGLQHAVNLRELNLRGNDIADVSPLAGMTSLTDLDLRGNEIVDVSPLAGMTSLTQLFLGSNEIADVSPLAGMTWLTYLNLNANRIVDVSPLAGMTWLTYLELDSNHIADVSPLAGMTSLTQLFLGSNEIADVSPLAGMTWLTYLNLNANRIVDVSPLAGMTSLTYLDLDSNHIADVSPLAGMTSLTQLFLGSNEIEDVGPLAANDGLGSGDSVDLTGNFLGLRSRESHIPTLLERGVDVRFTEFAELSEIPDVRLRRAAQWAMYASGWGCANGTCDDFGSLEILEASDRGIEDLTGLEGAEDLEGLFLDRNSITDISSLAGLNLAVLTLSYNKVEDLAPLAGMPLDFLALDGNSLCELPPRVGRVRYLYLNDNCLSNIDSLGRYGFVELQLNGNSITSLASLTGYLAYLHVNDNQVGDISPLNYAYLRELHIRNNAVRDISPLLDGERLLMVDLRRNPLADDALAVLDTLRERRVTVLAGETVPYFPAAGQGREGFVRVVNHSDEDGHVFIEAVDDAGARAGPVRMEVGARRAVHFNSADLEHGDTAKGLGGVGAPTAGDWRLSVISALDVEVLSYIRTGDGFVTAMHDVAADAMAPFFNPGSNQRQRSILRTVNTEAEPAKWTTGGYDDRGTWHPMAGSLLVRPQHALTLTAQALENEHGLGDGSGKWRLRVRGFPWYAMSLLESPTGHLTNLSTAPVNATALADGRTLHRLPLFPAAGGSREGFVRVINRSYSSGEVVIDAVDDAGARSGPVRLTMRPRRAAHFNSMDLEAGNAAKGLDGGVGVGQGDWRLEVTSELDLVVLSYARTADGFLTSLHDLAPVAEDGSHRVVFFNPGGNERQVSKLRLINDGERPARVSITGIDDEGGDSGTVTLGVPAGSAPTFTSAELEAGDGDRLTGRLGDGEGKWRLRVRSDQPIAVMSLLETPTGHLTNVSTGTAD